MDLFATVKSSGLVGAGGAGFPTHAKLSAKAEYIILNGAECEPLLRVDQQLMEIYPKEIIVGFAAAGAQVQAKKALIGIKQKHKKVVKILRQAIIENKLENYVQVCEMQDAYPSGDEQVMVYELLGRIVPEAGIPLQVGCVVINSETALNIYNAMAGNAVTEKYITLAGDIPNRITVKVPVGVKILDVLKLSGIEDFSDYAVIDGGPMMGPMLENINGNINKKHKGFIILKKDHPLAIKKSTTLEQARRVNKATCEQCRMCTDLCPRYLIGHAINPHRSMLGMNYDIGDVSAQKNAMLCCECNICELFACPANLYPRRANVYFKNKLREENIRYTTEKTEFKAHKMREYRKIPSKRLIARLGLSAFDLPAPITQTTIVPSSVQIELHQHVGAPAKPIVSVGTKVNCGDMIGDIQADSLGAAIHASITGVVTQVTDSYITIERGAQ